MPQQKKHFYKRSISIKQLRLEIIEKHGAQSQSVIYIYIYNIYNSTRSGWLWTPYFLNYFESELFYRAEPLIKNVSFVGARKNVSYSKLVSNPFRILRKMEFLSGKKCTKTFLGIKINTFVSISVNHMFQLLQEDR